MIRRIRLNSAGEVIRSATLAAISICLVITALLLICRGPMHGWHKMNLGRGVGAEGSHRHSLQIESPDEEYKSGLVTPSGIKRRWVIHASDKVQSKSLCIFKMPALQSLLYIFWQGNDRSTFDNRLAREIPATRNHS
jgi:hypothetical protein